MNLKIVGWCESRDITPIRNSENAHIIDSLEPGEIAHHLSVELPDGSHETVKVSECLFTKAIQYLSGR